MTKPRTVPITQRAIYQRINRKLSQHSRALKRARGSARDALGTYYVLDVERKSVLKHHLDLESYGWELGVLAEWETLR